MSSRNLAAAELRRDLDLILHEVRAGNQFQIMEGDEPVAVLAPVPRDARSLLRSLVAAGEITEPRVDLLDLKPLDSPRLEMSLGEALSEQREERLT